MKKIWAELDEGDRAIRVFKTFREACESPAYPDRIRKMDRYAAVGQIRRQLYERQHGDCIECGESITVNAHMDERVSRGEGGEISLENSQLLCPDCHIGIRGKHSDRNPQFTNSPKRKGQ